MRGGGQIVNSIIEEYLAQTDTINANTFVEFCGSSTQLNSTDITNNPNTHTFRQIACYAIGINETYAVLFFSNRDNDSNYTYGYAISIKLSNNTVSVVTTIKLNNLDIAFDSGAWSRIFGAKVEGTSYIIASTESNSNVDVILLLFSIDYSTGVLSYISKTNVTPMSSGSDPKILALGQGNFLLESGIDPQFNYIVFSVSAVGTITLKQDKVYSINYQLQGIMPSTGMIGAISPSKVILTSVTKTNKNIVSTYISVYNIANNGTITEDTSTRVPLILNNENSIQKLKSSTEIVKGKDFLVSMQLEIFKQYSTTGNSTAIWGFMKVSYNASNQKLVVSKISCPSYCVSKYVMGVVQKINSHRFIGFFGDPINITAYVQSVPVYAFEIYVSNSGIHFSEPMLLENIYEEYTHVPSHSCCLCGDKLLYISQVVKGSSGGGTSGKCIVTPLQLSPTQIKPSEVAIDGLLQSISTTTKAGKVALLKGVE